MRSICFLTIFILFVISCSNTATSSIVKYDYSMVEEYRITYVDVFNVDRDEYYIYYYQTTCLHCAKIKNAMIEYALENKGTMYFIQVLKDEGFRSINKEDTIGARDPLDAFAFMTPQLSLVKDKTIMETYLGEDEILKIIKT